LYALFDEMSAEDKGHFSDSFIDNTLALLAAISGCEPSLIADLTVKLNSKQTL